MHHTGTILGWSGLGFAESSPLSTVEGGVAQIVQLSDRDLTEPLILCSAKQLVLPLEDGYGGRTREVLVGLVDLGEQQMILAGKLAGEVMTLVGLRDRKSTRLNSSHIPLSRMPSSA